MGTCLYRAPTAGWTNFTPTFIQNKMFLELTTSGIGAATATVVNNPIGKAIIFNLIG